MKISFHPHADDEYLDSADWYEMPGLGKRFSEAVARRLESIFENPQQGTKKRGSYREVLVDKTFPFSSYFYGMRRSRKFLSQRFFIRAGTQAESTVKDIE